MSIRHSPLTQRFIGRVAAILGIVLAASWGPLSQTLHLVEVTERGNPDGERTYRVVLSHDCALNFARQHKDTARKTDVKTSNSSDSKTPTTSEHIFKALPESLESAHTIHFDASGAPVTELLSAWNRFTDGPVVAVELRAPRTFDVESSFARGPPGA